MTVVLLPDGRPQLRTVGRPPLLPPLDQPSLFDGPGAGWSAEATMASTAENQLAAALVRGIIEVLQGRRVLAHLMRWLDDDAAARIGQQRRRLTGTDPGRLRLCSIRVQVVIPGRAEVTARVGDADRSWAMALQLTCRGQRWRCTALELGPPPAGPGD